MESALPSGSFLARFAQRVATTPDKVAVRAQGRALTYRQVADRAAQLAQAVHDAVGTGREPLAVIAGHDEQAVIGFVAAAALHRPSVLLDTTTPVDRMRQVASIAEPAATLVGDGYDDAARGIGTATGHLVPLGPLGARVEGPAPDLTSFPVPPVGDGPSILNIVFTSGSTGVPKGVAQPDLAFVEAAAALDFGTLTVDEVACPAPLGFVMGSATITRHLLLGNTIHLWDPRRSGIAAMVPWMVESGITTITGTPNFLRNLSKAAIEQGVTFDDLKLILSGGEQLYASDVDLVWRCTGDDVVVVNAAGSSEGWSVASLVITRDYPLPPGAARMPIGRPAAGREILLVDDDLVPLQDPTATGMLLVVADEVAAGYWHQPELTHQRFITLPDGRGAYVTGDRGYWNADGQLELVGRADHMLKIRGNLVEPAEVEAQILAAGEVSECVVVGRADRAGTSVQLVAYVVPAASRWISGAALRRRLASALPMYMVPARIVELEALPHNANGKIDRQALPAVEDAPRAPADEHRTALHDAIAAICARALGVEAVGKHDDLFELGADSLAIEEIGAALESDLHIAATSTTLLENPTVAQLAELPRGRATGLVDGVVVRLAQGTPDARPIFFVAGAGGLAVGFRDLAQHLDQARPLYGLQAKGIEGGGRPDVTFRATVRRYVHAVRAVQPQGPYALVGHSLGALLAYEMARAFRADGADVTYLGLLDPLGVVGESTETGVPGFLRNQGQLSAEQRTTGAATGGRRFARETRERLQRERPYLTRSFWRTYREQPFVAYWRLGTSLAHGYVPPREGLVGVPCVVYGAADQLGDLPSVPDWSAFVQPTPQQVTVGGDHLTMLRPPFVSQLAARLQSDLEKAEAQRR